MSTKSDETRAGGTRTRLLDAAWDLARRDGVHALTLTGVAQSVGVSRQAVYLHFQSRAGLLTAMARHHDLASGFAERVQRSGDLAPLPALDALLRAWFGYLPDILPVARTLEAAAVTGDTGAGAFEDRMLGWRSEIRTAVHRLSVEHLLRTEWTTDGATDWVWSRVHPSVWQRLITERGWSARRFERVTLTSLHRDLLLET